MTSRQHLDTPATVICLVLGVVVVAAALPFAIASLPDTSPKKFDVNWSQETAAQGQLTFAGQPVNKVLTVNGLASMVRVDPSGACSDTANQVQAKATITYNVKKKVGNQESTVIDNTSYTCATKDGAKKEASLMGHADIASRDAADLNAARTSLWNQAGAGNETATYTLSITISRSTAPGTLPGIGPAAPTLAGSIDFSVLRWTAGVQPHQEEVTVR
ncbi:MAG TPA: hypothetical protein VM286_04690 [Candidatus Thermoplasmatota archaeon]|nr:hypothetical protein [Candidatus Thermoplasmatota archaeon]